MKPVLRSSVKIVPVYTNKYLRIAEVINGRAAIQGVLWGTIDWGMTGQNILQQCEDPVYAVSAGGVVAAIAAASAFADEKYWLPTPKVELINGRLAMLSFVILVGLSAM